MVKRIHVNSNRIRSNSKNGTDDPVITLRHGNKVMSYGHSVEILGPSTVVYRPESPLPCGAKVWIETESEVRVS